MAEEKIKHEPGPEDIGFEHEDLRSRSVLGFLLGLGIACVIIYFALRVVYGYMETNFAQRQSASASPLAPPASADTRIITPREVQKFPDPRLETNERLELRDFRLQEEQKLNGYSWVDQPGGAVRIPIDRAMQLIVQRGLPVEQSNAGQQNAGAAAMKQPGSVKSVMPGTQYPGSPH